MAFIFAQTKPVSTPMPNHLDQPKLGQHGGKRTKGHQADNISLNSRYGTSRAYILARLEREGFTDWIEAICTRQISAFAVACRLGWATRRETVAREDRNQARQRAIDPAALIG